MRQFFILAISMLALSSCNSKSDSSDHASKSSDKLNKLLSNDILTKDRIENENDSTLEELIFSNLYVNIKVDPKSTDEDYKNQFKKFTVPQQIFYSTLTLERNVKHFGFKGYFEHNQSVGQFAVYALNGYKELGLPEVSITVSKAIDMNKSDLKLSDSSFYKLDTILLRQIVEQNSSKERLKLIHNNIDSFITRR
ncbi:DMP19 family protein [Ferruginibacter sp.]|nr:hypothetical protein [Ferruginibacter sp.]